METMRRTLRTFAAVLAGLALVAALPTPCGCVPERSASKHADEHACCAPPAGVSADRTCCDESPAIDDAAPSPAGPVMVPVMVATLRSSCPRVPPSPLPSRPLSPSCASDPALRGRSVPARVKASAGRP